MAARTYIFAKEAEKEMQESRMEKEFTGKVEQGIIKNLVKNAKLNSKLGDKILAVIDPIYVHIPDWQRNIDIRVAHIISNNYDKYKWEIPKVLYYNGVLIVIDGQHRIYGAYKGGIESVVVEIMECEIEDAIDLFINQSKDRRKMRPVDIYHAAIKANKQEYLKLREICKKHNVCVIGDDIEGNPVGILTPITVGIKLINSDPNTLDRILNLLGKLQWNGYADTYNGKAYTAKIIRSLTTMYSYYDGHLDEMEKILVKECFGTEFFCNNVLNKTQGQIFDYLSSIVSHEMSNNIIVIPPSRKAKRKDITA